MSDIITTVCMAALGGGGLCLIAQLLIDLTKLTPARIMVLYTVCGVALYASGLFDPLLKIFGEGVSLPILGFGAALAKGVKQAIDTQGIIGIISGGLTATAPGITLTLTLGILLCFIFKGRPKRL